MDADLKPGDRIQLRNGEAGSIIRIEGSMAQIQLDSSLRKRVAIAALTKIEAAHVAPNASDTELDAASRLSTKTPGIRVLLAEPDTALARLIQTALAASKLVFDVQPVDRLSAVLAALADQRFNLILLDLQLADSSGLQTLESVVAASPVPIIVLAGADEEVDAARIRALGAEYFLRKAELNTNSLIASMRQAVSQHRQLPLDESVRPAWRELCREISVSAAGIEHALEVFQQRRLDPAEQAALTSAKAHLQRLRLTLARHPTS